MLPTNNEVIEKGELVKNLNTNELGISQNNFLGDLNKSMPKSCKFEAQYLYILSDEEIQVGDWFISCSISHPEPIRVESDIHAQDVMYARKKQNLFLKIIATTDTKLNVSVWDDFNKTISKGMEDGKLPKPDSGGLPRPSKAFIKKYAELGGIDEVMVEYGFDKGVDLYEEQMINLKVSKDNTITIKAIENNTQLESQLIILGFKDGKSTLSLLKNYQSFIYDKLSSELCIFNVGEDLPCEEFKDDIYSKLSNHLNDKPVFNNQLPKVPTHIEEKVNLDEFLFAKYQEAYDSTQEGQNYPNPLTDYQLAWVKEFMNKK